MPPLQLSTSPSASAASAGPVANANGSNATGLDAARSNSSHWQGKLELTYRAEQRSGQPTTAIAHSYTEAPLRLQRPFYPEGPARCQSVIVHTAGGMVGGDRLDFDIRLEANTQAMLTTAAAAKIYRSKGPEAIQNIQVHVARGACLEWLPQETIVFNQANYRQQMRVVLEPGAQWLGWEVTRLGRTAMDEQFVAGHWRSRTEVYQQQDDSVRPLWIDRQWLPGSPETWISPHGLNSCPVIGSFSWFGATFDDQLLAEIRAAWANQLAPPTECAGVTRLNAGLLCRYRGHSTSLANRWFRQVWQCIRQAQLGQPPSDQPQLAIPAKVPRVWQH